MVDVKDNQLFLIQLVDKYVCSCSLFNFRLFNRFKYDCVCDNENYIKTLICKINIYEK